MHSGRKMASTSTTFKTLETTAKIFDGNRWQKRYFVLQKSSCGNSGTLYVFKSAKNVRKFRAKKQTLTIEGFFGVESGFRLGDEKHTLAIICQARVINLAFANESTLVTWEWSIRKAFGFGYQYSLFTLDAPPSLSLICNTYVRLHLFDGRFCLVADTPPKLIADFRFGEIRRFGAFENKFCIEAGSRTGAWAGVYVFRTGHCDQMASTFRLASFERLGDYLSSNESSTSDTKANSSSVPEYKTVVISRNMEKTIPSHLDFGQETHVSLDDKKPLISPFDADRQEIAVEYAKIDSVATQAARKVIKARKEDVASRKSSTEYEDSISRWSSTEYLFKAEPRAKGWRKRPTELLQNMFRHH